MIFSRRHDFLFIKGRKVAGTSVEMALSGICGPDDIITSITPIDELERLNTGGRGAQSYSDDPVAERLYLSKLVKQGPEAVKKGSSKGHLYTSHMSLREFIGRFGSLPTERVFCVERCPYAKIISRAVMADGFGEYKRTGREMKANLDRIQRIVAKQLARPGGIDACRNIELYRGPTRDLSVRVLRHETLTEDFWLLMKDYGISPVPELPHAKKGVGSNTIDPRTVFSRGQLDRINEIYAEEFGAFGYEPI